MRVTQLPAGAYRLVEQVFVHRRLGATDPAYIVANDALIDGRPGKRLIRLADSINLAQ